MASVINVTGVQVKNNPTTVLAPFELEVSFECLEELKNDVSWKLTYICSAEDKSKDQQLDCVELGPIQRGSLRFSFIADPPNFSLMPVEEIHGITVVLLTAAYRGREFSRVGWYVHNFYEDPVLELDPPDPPRFELMRRLVLTDDPRITRFNIDWDPNTEEDVEMKES